MRFIFEELSVSTKRPFTVKATLSEEEKKTLVAFSKKAQMSEAELIRYFLRPDDAVTRGVPACPAGRVSDEVPRSG